MNRSTTSRVPALAALATALVPAVLAVGTVPAQAAPPTSTRIEATAVSPARLAPAVDAYRALLGGVNNGSTPGSQAGGRREINWDGVRDGQASPNSMPANLFNTAVPRGAVFHAPGGNRFQVSADSANPTNSTVEFGNIRPQNVVNFTPFSRERLFTPVGTTTTRVRFFVPGSNTPATVKGFGAVFTDVDRAGSTRIAAYDRWGQHLWSRDVPRGQRADGTLSFLGVRTSARIFEVRITSGNTPIGPHVTDGGPRDLVALDDLIYSEPKAL
ncbi:hypothetical protein NUM3379_39260 [Kineococcus sp. NUM-3379]